MIPTKLIISNFTSYGSEPQVLDFTLLHMAAISGQNGVGKSSMLEAITWSLWGSSRAGESADALVRLGQSEMYVEFEFQLDKHIYTVKRKRVKKSGGSTSLEFWSGSHNLTEGTIKATQQKIINTLHLTYETFTNSSFLRQGHADEFTNKGPSDRKRILADILGLDHYDLLEERAKERAKDAHTKLQLLEYQLLEIEAELSQKEEREKSLSLAEEEAKVAEKELEGVESALKEIQEKENTASALVQSLQEKKLQIQNTQKELLDLKLQIEMKERAKQEFQTIIDRKEEIEQKYMEIQTLQAEKKLLEGKRSELIVVKDELTALQKTIIELEDRRSKAITSLEVETKKLQTENAEHQITIDHLIAHKDTCPTCKQTIGEKINQEILETKQKSIDENITKLKELETKLGKCKTYVIKEQVDANEKENQVKKLEEETKKWSTIAQQLMMLEKYEPLYLRLKEASSAVQTQIEAIIDLQKILLSRQDQIKASEDELKDLQLFEQKLQQIRMEKRAKELNKQELAQKALSARSRAGEAKQLVSRAKQLEELFTKRGAEKKSLTHEKQAFEELALAFGKKGIQAMIIEAAIPEVEDEANKLLTSLTDGRMQVRFDTQRETKTKVLKEDGKKEFATVETLDIIISDEMGERAYEMYSGGETFRVNFALRLAISQLLTRRAGAKLQFLVIDEGFGTQDSQGRTKIIEVLNAIKDDFERILIITHIDELKEEFPTRIEVAKGTTGSTFAVISS